MTYASRYETYYVHFPLDTCNSQTANKIEDTFRQTLYDLYFDDFIKKVSFRFVFALSHT